MILSLKLSCKTFNGFIRHSLPRALCVEDGSLPRPRSRNRCIDLHKRLEIMLTEHRPWKSEDRLLCTASGTVPRRGHFQDSQRSSFRRASAQAGLIQWRCLDCHRKEASSLIDRIGFEKICRLALTINRIPTFLCATCCEYQPETSDVLFGVDSKLRLPWASFPETILNSNGSEQFLFGSKDLT